MGERNPPGFREPEYPYRFSGNIRFGRRVGKDDAVCNQVV